MTNSRRYAGVAAMIALLMLCALGANARRHLSGNRGSGVPHAVALAALLVGVAAAGVVIVLLGRSRRWQTPGSSRSLLYTALATLVILSLVVVVLILASRSGPLPSPAGHGSAPRPSAAPSATRSAGGEQGSRGSGTVLPVLATLLVVGVIGALVARRRPGTAPAPEPARDPEVETAVDLEHVLGRAATAMLDVDAPRDAIIAAYEQMQRAAQERGLVRAVSDTPAEFLARAAGSGAVDPMAAARLTALFERARFSHLPITEADRADAQDALVELRAGWARS